MERGVAQQLQNLATLKADRGKVITTNTLSFLSQPGTPHQIVFVDPPFRQGLLEETLRLLETQGWLADEALVYVESEVENGLPPVPANWQLYREKWPDRSPTVFTNVRPKESTMLINLGRLLMLCVWAFLLLNLFQPFPKPLNIFVNVALIFMILMHGLQLTLLKATQPKVAPPLSRFEQIRILFSACLSSWPGRKTEGDAENSPERAQGSGVNATNAVPL